MALDALNPVEVVFLAANPFHIAKSWGFQGADSKTPTKTLAIFV